MLDLRPHSRLDGGGCSNLRWEAINLVALRRSAYFSMDHHHLFESKLSVVEAGKEEGKKMGIKFR